MDYYRADEIGKRSLSNLIQDNWLNKNQSVGKGIKNAMSEKMKAFGTRVKRNFTGMNMIKTLTGSNLLTATYGKMTGKSKSDISYFTGRKKPKARRIGNIMGLPGMESVEDITSSLLQSMFDFMVQSEASKQRRAETERSFREEKDNEEQRRQTQFLRVLSEFTGVGAATKVEEKKDGGGFLDMLKGLWDSFIKPFKWALDWVMNNKKLLLSIARFFAGPLGVAMLAGGAIIWLAEQLKEYFRNNVPDMKIVSPSEAAGLLQGNQKDIDKFPGGEKALREIIANAPKRATEILARGDNREILAAGGEKKLKEIETDIIAQPPKRDAMLDMAETGPTRENFIKYGRGTKATNAAKWDREFGPYFDPITGKRLEKAKPVESAPTSVKPAMATPVQEMPAETKESVPTAAPVSSAPTLGKINESIAENNTLNLEESTGGSSDTKPIIMQNNKSNHLKDTPISSTATTRDQTPIMEHVRRLSASPI
jgi:hypothetical protein